MAPARIVTFYSYKGGVGRTAALANTAWILATNGYRVCAIDWDLEAPGLHRYFYPFLLDRELTSTDGLIDFLVDYVNQAMTPAEEPRQDDWYRSYADLSTYAVPVNWAHFPSSGSLDLVVAGRQGPSYAAKVNSFEWQTFYQHFGGGTFLDEVKRQLCDEYDFVLIDSRTGVSDTAGICTAQLPDQLVACFMHNAQSIEGTAAVAESAAALRVNSPLEVFPVPMRVELAEKERYDRARVFAHKRFSGFLQHLSPARQTAYWSDVQVIYQAYYAYEEVLATFSDPTGDRLTVLSAIERLCKRLTHGTVSRLRPPPEAERLRVLDEYGRRFAPEVHPVQHASPRPVSHPDPDPDDRDEPEDGELSRPARAEKLSSGAIMQLLFAVLFLAAFAVALVTNQATLKAVAVFLAALAFAFGLLRSSALGNDASLIQAVRRRVSRFDRRYRKFVLNSLRFIDLKGLTTLGFATPELDEVFVEVSVTFRAPHQVSGGMLVTSAVDSTERHSIGDFVDREEPVILAVVGAPGSGKTTLLKHTAQAVCLDRRARRPVPILLYLRDHGLAIVKEPTIGLADLVRGTLGRHSFGEPPGWFEQQLRDGRCVVLLDGLDEVVRPEDRRAVVDWVERQTGQYPGNDFVITTRPMGYLAAPISGAFVLQVRSFSDKQVARFVRGWYRSVERHSTGSPDSAARADAAAEDLLARLDSTPQLTALTVNPMLLTMIANVHRFRGALPGSRVDLYREICQVMLWRRQEAKQLATGLSGDKKEQLLRGLALTMMRRRMRDMPLDALLDEIEPALLRTSTSLTARDFVADVSSTGLLIERESGLYAFAHLVFQEYLAAANIRDRGLDTVLTETVDDAWWRETALLYAALGNVDAIVTACLKSGSETALSLATDCADQGRDLSPYLRDRLLAALGRNAPFA